MGEASEIKFNEEMKRTCLLNKEERRFFDREKVLGKRNGKTARRDWLPERI